MYLLSNLLEKYIEDRDSLKCRHDLLYLKGLISDMALQDDIPFAEDVTCVCDIFEKLLKKIGIPEKYGCGEINRELLVQVAFEEYRNGYFDSACDFLYYKSYVAEMIDFPYIIHYSPDKDEYYIKDMSPEKSEETASVFLAETTAG